MNTIYKKVDPKAVDMSVIEEAGRIIKAGGLVAFPTETVYGLGADALCAASSKKIYEAKGRPCDNPLIVHIAEFESIYRIVKTVPDEAVTLAKKFWPGPLTMIFAKDDTVPYETTGGLDTVAVRFPSHPVAKAFIKQSGGYIAAPSANISGRPSPTTGEHVLADMDGRIDMIIDSGPCDIGLESTIIDLTSSVPMLLRPGYVNDMMLKDILGNMEKDPAVFGEVLPGVKPRAPGMKYRHYAPKGSLTIVSGKDEDVIRHIRSMTESRTGDARIGVIACSEHVNCYPMADIVADAGDRDNEEETAARLYDILRGFDDENIDVIYSEEFDSPGLGLAIMNRLIKAAGHNIIKV